MIGKQKTSRKSRKEFCQIVDQWRTSGLTRREYCQQEKYNSHTFNVWITKAQTNSPSEPLNLVPLQIHECHSFEASSGFEVEYPNGVRLRLSTLPGTEELSRIIHIYGEPCFH